MYNAPYQGVANDLAKYGRYGDSMLVHMNPIEVQMLASLSPTGRLTTNPMTGQKEAFLPFLAPLLGSMLGNAVLGSTLGATAAGALGSAAATTLATGDLEQGIMSGITGFGIGSALGAAGNAATEAAKTATTQAATDAATTFSPSAAAATMNPLAADTTLRAAIESTPSIFSPGAAGAQMTAAPNFADVVATPPVTPPTPTFTERLAAPVQQPGAFFSALTEPASFLPMYVGETGRMAREQELMGRGSMKAFEEEQEAQRQKTLGDISGVYNRIRSAYPVGYAQGGQVEKYKAGAAIPNRQQQKIDDLQGLLDQYNAINNLNIPDPKDVQLSLRGSEFVPPPAASYSALDVGGAGYLPGIAPEFQYFREPPPPPPTGYVPPPPGTVAGGGGGYPPGGGTGPVAGGRPAFDPTLFRGKQPRDEGDVFLNTGDAYGGVTQPQYDLSNLPTDFNYMGNFGTYIPSSQEIDMAGGIGAFNQPEMPVVDQAAVMPEEQRIFASRELQVPVSQFAMPEIDMTDDEMNPFSSFREPREKRYGGGMMYAEGGMTEGDMGDQSIVEMTVAAIRGEVENADEIISRFLDMYGPEAFAELRDRVLKDIVPGAQTEGMIEGEGGGQDDLVEGMIGTQRPVAVSPGEYIIPADVVSLAGGGYSGDGAKYFDNLIEDIRMKTMGKTDQIKPYRTGGRS